MILEFPPVQPKPDDDYNSIREPLAHALDNLSKSIWVSRHVYLLGITGDEKTAAEYASAPIEQCAFLLKSNANALRDRELVDLPEVHDALERAGSALIAGVFLMRTLRSTFHTPASEKAG